MAYYERRLASALVHGVWPSPSLVAATSPMVVERPREITGGLGLDPAFDVIGREQTALQVVDFPMLAHLDGFDQSILWPPAASTYSIAKPAVDQLLGGAALEGCGNDGRPINSALEGAFSGMTRSHTRLDTITVLPL